MDWTSKPINLTEEQREWFKLHSDLYAVLNPITSLGTSEHMREAIEALKPIARRVLGEPTH